MNHRLLVLATPCLLIACGAPDSGVGTDEPIAQDEQNFFYMQSRIWDHKSLSVCWAPDNLSDGAAASQRKWIRDAVERDISSLVDVDFTYWGDCGVTGADISIALQADVWPHASVIGRRTASSTPSLYMNSFMEDPVDLDGDGSLDLTWCWSGSSVQSLNGMKWSSGRMYCQQTIAVHEFLHLLAVTHEQYRPDRPSYCGLDPDDTPVGDTSYGAFDILSVSNYCNPMWAGETALSPNDLSGLVGLYGARTNDLVYYSFGNVRDWSAVATDKVGFRIRPQDVSGTYTPLIGDFNRDGEDDIFWYRPGTGSDPIWWGRTDYTFENGTSSGVEGTYVPVTGDFDGSGTTDIFWHAPGSATDRIWWGRTDKTFTSGITSNVNGTFVPVAGDFDGDDKDDIFFYAAGSPQEVVWWGRSDDTFDSINVSGNVTGTYKPLSGDFNGDGRDDIFWYCAGSCADYVWWGNLNRTFTSQDMEVSGTYDPAVGDFDGDGVDDILWSSWENIDDYLWLFNRIPRGTHVGTTTSMTIHNKPYAGDFDGDGFSDIFWYQPGSMVP